MDTDLFDDSMVFDPYLLDTNRSLGKFCYSKDEVWQSFMTPEFDTISTLQPPLWETEKTPPRVDRSEAKTSKRTRLEGLEGKEEDDDKDKREPEKKAPKTETKFFIYKGLKYVGPTRATRPNYKAKQEWEWEIYPHGISKQNGKLRVQIKQKGVNPTYPSFPNSLKGLLAAALFRDNETLRLWEERVLVRAPKFNFEHEDLPEKKERKPLNPPPRKKRPMRKRRRNPLRGRDYPSHRERVGEQEDDDEVSEIDM